MKKGKIGFGTGIGAGRKVLFAVVLAAILAGAAGCSEKETVLLDSEDLVRLEGSGEGSDTLGVDRELVSGMDSDADVRAASGEGPGAGPERNEEDAFRAGGGNTGEGGNGVEISTLFVHICGEVMRPGVYELPEGSRVYEAVEEAGGFTQDAAADYVNLAYILEDGWKIEIPSRENPETDGEGKETGISSGISGDAGWIGTGNGSGDFGSDASGDGLVDINTATKQELITLPGVGESRAESIISYREKNGGFSKIEDIMKVEGIKDGMFAKMKDKICVRGVK